jgi:chromosome partitioning protein
MSTSFPSNVNLAGAEIDLINMSDHFHVLRNAFDFIKDKYDFMLLDCPPSLSMLTVNAFTAADTVLVPIQCEYYALEGLSQLINSINMTRKNLNPKLEIDGIVFTMYDARTNLSMQVVQDVQSHIRNHVYQTIIPRSIRLAEAPSYASRSLSMIQNQRARRPIVHWPRK